MLLHDIRRHLAERLRFYRETRRLERLDDRLLADMGINRATIAERVAGRL